MSSPRPSKRQRIYRACDQCRRRKSKCDGEKPVCAICRAADRSCTYQNGGGRRGLAPGYVRSLETIMGLVIQHVPNSESKVHDLLAKSRSNGHFLAKDPAAVWRKSRLARDFPTLPEPDSQEGPSLSIPEESEWEPLEISNTPGLVTTGAALTTSGLNESALPHDMPNMVQGPTDVLTLQYPTNTSKILEDYFTYTHCWFPIMEHHDLLKTMHSSLQTQKDPHNGSRVALWAIIAYETCSNDETGNKDPGQPDCEQILNSIHPCLMAQSSKTELGHIQGAIILALLQIKLGDVAYAWRLAGWACRMLASLPSAASNARYRHTFHGCILLDNMTSTLLNEAPCMSLIGQQKEGNINEDNMEEWAIWTIPPHHSEGRHRDSPQGPLRALSISNDVNHLMMFLARILYMQSPIPITDGLDILATLQAEQQTLTEKHPHNRGAGYVTPPALILHLTCNFVMLALLRRCPTLDPNGKELVRRLLQSTLLLLDLYVEITGPLRISPLLRVFALQCRHSLDMAFASGHCEEQEALNCRLCSYLPDLKEGQGTPCGNIAIPQMASRETPLPAMINFDAAGSGANVSNEVFVQPAALQILQTQLDIPTSKNSINSMSDASKFSASEPPTAAVFAETEGFDELFEEMVTSIPTKRQEPTFAQNLGFYAGDLDNDFLAQLQQLPDS